MCHQGIRRWHRKAISFQFPTLRLTEDSFKLSKSGIESDLTKETPQWILSSYGPGFEAPLQLFGGQPREQSFEELRLRHYDLAAQGKEQQAIQEAQALFSDAEQQMRTTLNDVDGAIKYIADGENQHPNRIDECKLRGTRHFQTQSNTLNKQQPTLSSGHPVAPTPAFGLPTASSTFGRVSAPTFGQPSAPNSRQGQSMAQVFGQPSAPKSTFDQISTSSQPPGFGRPLSTANQEPFSTFGKPLNVLPAFGQAGTSASLDVPQQSSSDAISMSTNSTFSKTALSSQPLRGGSPRIFNQSSTPIQTGIFGGPPAPNPADTVPQSTATHFSESSDRAASLNPFGGRVAPTSTDMFRRPSGTALELSSQAYTSAAASRAAQQPHESTLNSISTSRQTSGGIKGRRDDQGKVTSWDGMTVRYANNEPCYKARDGSLQRIWFPDGAPIFKKNYDLPDEAYDEQIEEDFKFLRQNATFKNGIMPMLPPKKAWCGWAL